MYKRDNSLRRHYKRDLRCARYALARTLQTLTSFSGLLLQHESGGIYDEPAPAPRSSPRKARITLEVFRIRFSLTCRSFLPDTSASLAGLTLATTGVKSLFADATGKAKQLGLHMSLMRAFNKSSQYKGFSHEP